jgi:hypothetical protein
LRALDDAYAPFKGPAKCSKAAKAREDFPARSRRRLIKECLDAIEQATYRRRGDAR